MNRFPSLVLLLAATLVAGGCAGTGKTTKIKPRPPAVATASGDLAAARTAIAAAEQLNRRDPAGAVGHYLHATRLAQNRFVRNPGDEAARDTASFALSRAFGVMEQAKINPWTQPMSVASPGGPIQVTHKPDPRPAWKPSLFDFTPADQYGLKGSYVATRNTRKGAGAPLVAIIPEDRAPMHNPLDSENIYYGVTAVARFDGARCQIEFLDPLGSETVSLDGRHVPLAADFTTPLAFMLETDKSLLMSFGRLLKPADFADTAQVTRLQPYDPDKTIVLCIHGLASEPSTWIPMINALRGDPEIRRHYQFWFYSYPSGWPFPHSAAMLRRELDEVERTMRPRKPLVVIGHSMGGCISRLLITDSHGERLWRETLGRDPSTLKLSPQSRKLFTEALVFEPRREVSRVIFVSAPLRGSDIATNPLGRFASKLIKSPASFLQAGTELLASIPAQFGAGDLKLKQIPNSVDTLAPNNRFVKAINTIPVENKVPHHVICGDRGKGGNKDRTKPVMSDGVVPYWSSHMETAASEKIVPSNHSAQQNPEAIAEVNRILKLHSRR